MGGKCLVIARSFFVFRRAGAFQLTAVPAAAPATTASSRLPSIRRPSIPVVLVDREGGERELARRAGVWGRLVIGEAGEARMLRCQLEIGTARSGGDFCPLFFKRGHDS